MFGEEREETGKLTNKVMGRGREERKEFLERRVTHRHTRRRRLPIPNELTPGAAAGALCAASDAP